MVLTETTLILFVSLKPGKNLVSLLLNLFTIPRQITRFLAFPNSQLKYFQHQIGGGTDFLM